MLDIYYLFHIITIISSVWTVRFGDIYTSYIYGLLDFLRIYILRIYIWIVRFFADIYTSYIYMDC